ncbi:MAG: HigA family addiction module antitoxin, partial [Microcystis panniformis]
MNNWKSPIHPGEILADELEEINLNVSQLATRVNISEYEIEQILKGQGNITGDIALKLGRFFNTGSEIWMNLQKAYELD